MGGGEILFFCYLESCAKFDTLVHDVGGLIKALDNLTFKKILGNIKKLHMKNVSSFHLECFTLLTSLKQLINVLKI